jgi:glutathione S-transferase
MAYPRGAVKLYYTPTSPFVRKVLVAAHELELSARIELELLRPSPTRADATLSRANPLNKIPVLVTDEGEGIYDSPVICEYLAALAPHRALVPAAGSERWRVLRVQALCDGVLDAAILVFYERSHRPKELWWPAWLDGQTEKALQGLDALEREAAHFGDAVDLGQIAAGVTLGWLEFRDVFGDQRSARPALNGWYERFRQRPSMKATEPHV